MSQLGDNQQTGSNSYTSNAQEVTVQSKPDVLGDLNAYIEKWLSNYTQGQERDDSLWEIFRESFESWPEETFKLADQDKINTLRTALAKTEFG